MTAPYRAMYDAMTLALRLPPGMCADVCDHASCQGWRDDAEAGLSAARASYRAGGRGFVVTMAAADALQARMYAQIPDRFRPVDSVQRKMDYSSVFMPMASALLAAAEAARRRAQVGTAAA